MPHKDRATRLAYLAAYRAKHRPAPAPERQPGEPELPPRGAMRYDASGERVECHACGALLRSLNSHLKLHGLDAASYKEAYGLGRMQSLLPPATQERFREATLARPMAAGMTPFEDGNAGRRHGITARLGSRIVESEDRRGWNMRGREPKPPRGM